jgi:hypothetical protein
MPDLYTSLVFFHILLFVFWLGADLGVAILGGEFRKRDYSLQERLTILKLLVKTDMGPRTAWALMIGSTVSLLYSGGYVEMSSLWVVLAWAVSLIWLWLVWTAYRAGQTPKAAKLKKIEGILKWGLAAFYLGLGAISLLHDAPIAENWLASKALLFGFIFVAAILIDVFFKPVGLLLMTLVNEGSSDATEAPLRAQMDKSRFWVRMTYLLLLITGFIGTTKFF